MLDVLAAARLTQRIKEEASVNNIIVKGKVKKKVAQEIFMYMVAVAKRLKVFWSRRFRSALVYLGRTRFALRNWEPHFATTHCRLRHACLGQK